MATEQEMKDFEAEAARLEAEAEKEHNAKKKDKKKKVKKEFKTFNQLDDRFQVKEGMDPEIIFPEEKVMIETLRAKIPDLIYFSDKWIVFFLCARRHDMEEVEDLITRHLKTRRDYGWHPKEIPDLLADPDTVKIMNAKMAYRPPHTIDKHERLVTYFWMGKNDPHGRTLKSMLTWSFWETEWLVETEPLKYLRNGSVWLMDMSGFSFFKNVDTTPTGRAWGQALTGLFPQRYRDIYIWNSGIFFRALLAAARWVMPKKLVKRFHSIKESELFDICDKKYVLERYGGELGEDWDFAKAQYERDDKKMRKSKKNIRKAVRELKKELKAELNAVDELNASTEKLVITTPSKETLVS